MYICGTFFTGSIRLFTSIHAYIFVIFTSPLVFSRFWCAIIMKMILEEVHHYLCDYHLFICFSLCIHSHLLLMFLHYYENDSCQVGGWATAHQMHCSLTLFYIIILCIMITLKQSNKLRFVNAIIAFLGEKMWILKKKNHSRKDNPFAKFVFISFIALLEGICVHYQTLSALIYSLFWNHLPLLVVNLHL